MKKTLRVATILSWFNLVFWGLLDGLVLLWGLFGMNLPILASAVLLSAVPLNAYAALRLQRSVRHPGIPLSHQTPAGIRFVGFIALFIGVNWLGYGFEMIKDAGSLLQSFEDQLKQMTDILQQTPQLTAINVTEVRWMGGFMLVFGICVALNVVLNLRLLRWYYQMKKNDVS